jgi:hypothetical protein
MKKLIPYLAAGLLAVGTQLAMAQSATTSTNSADQTPAQTHKQLTPEQRQEHILKLVGLTAADVKDLAPKERRAKIKEAAEAVSAKLKAKQTDGSITPKEEKRLKEIEKFLTHPGHKAAGASQSTTNAPQQ